MFFSCYFQGFFFVFDSAFLGWCVCFGSLWIYLSYLEFIEFPGCVSYCFLNKFGTFSGIISFSLYSLFLFGSSLYIYIGALNGVSHFSEAVFIFLHSFSLYSSTCIISSLSIFKFVNYFFCPFKSILEPLVNFLFKLLYFSNGGFSFVFLFL